MLTVVLDESLGIETAIPNLPPAFCGQAYLLRGQNGRRHTWRSFRQLPRAPFSRDSGGRRRSGDLFTVASDSLGAAERLHLVVRGSRSVDPALPARAIARFLGLCSYLWLPNGETTSTIDVLHRDDDLRRVSGWIRAASCISRSRSRERCRPPARAGVASITPSSGPASGGTPVTIAGGNFQPGAQLEIGGQPVGATFVDPTQLTSATPALAPGTLNAVVVVNPDSGNAALLNGFFADFLDVPPSNISTTTSKSFSVAA